MHWVLVFKDTKGIWQIKNVIKDNRGRNKRHKISWNEVKRIAGDPIPWKRFMDPLCSTRSKRI
jgi:hypothetical protein